MSVQALKLISCLPQDQLGSSKTLAANLESTQDQAKTAAQRAESLSADLAKSHAECERLRQEFKEQLQELQQQLQGQEEGAGALLQRALTAEASAVQVW